MTQWAEGGFAQFWQPGSTPLIQPKGESLLYKGFMLTIFYLFRMGSQLSPDDKMLIIRGLHAFASMVTVILGYRIARRQAGPAAGEFAGILLAILWFIPWTTVRNLPEVLVIPILVAGVWLLINRKKPPLIPALLSGVIMGMAFSIWFGSGFFIIGIIPALVFMGMFTELLLFSAGLFLSVGLLQGIPDILVWGKPYVEITIYYKTIIQNTFRINFPDSLMYMAILTLLIIPPFSIFLLWGFVRMWKRLMLIVFPTTIFILWFALGSSPSMPHILPSVPFVIIAGASGWMLYIRGSNLAVKYQKSYNYILTAFWIINIGLLSLATTMYSNKSRIEAFKHISNFKDIRSYLIENSTDSAEIAFPKFYLGQLVSEYQLNKGIDKKILFDRIKSDKVNMPRFVFFVDEKDFKKRIQNVYPLVLNIGYQSTFEAGPAEKILEKVRFCEAGKTIIIYRNNYFYEGRSD